MQESTPEAIVIDSVVSGATAIGLIGTAPDRPYEPEEAVILARTMSVIIADQRMQIAILQNELRFAQGAFCAVVIICAMALAILFR